MLDNEVLLGHLALEGKKERKETRVSPNLVASEVLGLSREKVICFQASLRNSNKNLCVKRYLAQVRGKTRAAAEKEPGNKIGQIT